MRVLLQRSLASSVEVENQVVGKIKKGLVVFVGFTDGDTIEDIEKLVHKLLHLRIFDDETGVMNRSILDVQGEILSISQFTLYANVEKGRRPSYAKALKSDEAKKLYEKFNETLLKTGIPVETGVFGAEMLVHIQNDGPITIALESGKKDE